MKQLDWKSYLYSTLGFLKYFGQRFNSDNTNITAGHLTYVSMLSLVPLLVVMFTVFSAFPMFNELKENLEQALFANLLPTSGEQLEQYLNEFVTNASKMTTIGVGFLFIVAIMLMSAIDKALNSIWRDSSRRHWLVSFAVYWMLLTLGPVLIGSGLAATSYLISLSQFADAYVSGVQSFLFWFVPIVTSFVFFVLMYQLVPNRQVKFRYAAFGAAIAAVLFELSKQLFSLYITFFPTYQAIYGALATIPILIVWIYLSWLIVLIGAVLTVSLEEYQLRQPEPKSD
ncbi:virulence factor BrkB family protein [Idiomarina sp. HP20-50]|uniref:virulence factor BrkB family protein n=1 Tax=Idiomarina sp. HP20-50 TaxID=3070813 RepID=UPI00294AC732|nr:virulence factor BrkB family protein [Idiomarina sp. HP20-50]MDV6316655.1 virulence factor BrkB family protein [Idiomarina sp. HP20-50]